MTEFPISRLYELGRLSQAGDIVTLAPSDEERARIARWADVDRVASFAARIELRKLSPTRYSIDADLGADIEQSCVVTLDPVRSRIERTFRRDLVLTPAAHRSMPKDAALDVAPVDEDGREEIASLRYDLAVPVLEEFALAVDPYPRAAGVEFRAPDDPQAQPEQPFAALKRLKEGP